MAVGQQLKEIILEVWWLNFASSWSCNAPGSVCGGFRVGRPTPNVGGVVPWAKEEKLRWETPCSLNPSLTLASTATDSAPPSTIWLLPLNHKPKQTPSFSCGCHSNGKSHHRKQTRLAAHSGVAGWNHIAPVPSPFVLAPLHCPFLSATTPWSLVSRMGLGTWVVFVRLAHC